MSNKILGSEKFKILKVHGKVAIKFGKVSYPDPDWTKHLDKSMSYPYVEITIIETGKKINAVHVVWDPGENVWEITERRK